MSAGADGRLYLQGDRDVYVVETAPGAVVSTYGPVANLRAAARAPNGDVLAFSGTQGPVVVFDHPDSASALTDVPSALSNAFGGVELAPDGSAVVHTLPSRMVPNDESTHRRIDDEGRWVGVVRTGAPGQLMLSTGEAASFSYGGLIIDETSYTVASGLPSDDVRDVVEDGAGQVWVGTSEGLVQWTDDGFTAVDDRAIRDLFLDADGRVWAATNEGLFWLGDGQLNHSFGVDDPDVTAMFSDGSGVMWVLTTTGLYRRTDTRQFVRYDLDDEVDIVPSTMGFLADSRVLLGTPDRGLFVIQPDGHIESFRQGDGLPSNTITSIAVEPEGAQRAFVATAGGLSQFVAGLVPLQPAVCGDGVVAFSEDCDDEGARRCVATKIVERRNAA